MPDDLVTGVGSVIVWAGASLLTLFLIVFGAAHGAAFLSRLLRRKD